MTFLARASFKCFRPVNFLTFSTACEILIFDLRVQCLPAPAFGTVRFSLMGFISLTSENSCLMSGCLLENIYPNSQEKHKTYEALDIL